MADPRPVAKRAIAACGRAKRFLGRPGVVKTDGKRGNPGGALARMPATWERRALSTNCPIACSRPLGDIIDALPEQRLAETLRIAESQMSYFVDHWRGTQSLARAFWVNFALVGVLVNAGEGLVRPSHVGMEAFAFIAIAYLLLARVILFTWQVVGVLRSADRHVREGGDLAWANAAYAGIVLGALATMVAAVGTLQLVLGHLQSSDAGTASPPTYSLAWQPAHLRIELRGPIEHGLTRDFAQLLARHPGAEALLLESEGGNVYEARGVARLVLARKLDTYVYGVCNSACATVFLAGRRRYLGGDGAIGFHRYQLDGINGHPLVDPSAEHARDRAFYVQRGVDDAFSQQVFETDHDAIWIPDAAQLRAAGVVHGVLE